MDTAEVTSFLFQRIKSLEPEDAAKIIGYLILQEGYEAQGFAKLASSSKGDIQEIILKVKSELNELRSRRSPTSVAMNALPDSGFSSSKFGPFSHMQCPLDQLYSPFFPARHNADFSPIPRADTISALNNTQSLGNHTGLSNELLYPDERWNISTREASPYPGLNEFPLKTCYFFKKGHCKNGISCKYFHGRSPQNSPPIFDGITENNNFLPGSLAMLELEIVELLRSRKGNPISIASLPLMYLERYGKLLQAEGYLTESQRHGKSGFSLTRLLSRLKNSIRLIDRPHGQHSVILAEDAANYMETRSNRNDPGPIVSGSRQIYLTFPAESTFTDNHVRDYFSQFGPVEDVRIPCQDRRMFGFVSFESVDTVKIVLAKGNPHYVCSSRVLVKPYREKPKFLGRKYQERVDASVYGPSFHADMDADPHTWMRKFMLMKNHLQQQQALAVELERRRLAGVRIGQNPATSQLSLGYAMCGREDSEAESYDMSSAGIYSLVHSVLSDGSENYDKIKDLDNDIVDKDSRLILAESKLGAQGTSTPFTR